MIGALIIALQLATAGPPALAVRGASGGRATSVPVTRTEAGPVVAVDRLARALPLAVESRPNQHWRLRIADVELDVADRVPFATVQGAVVPLATAPFARDGQLVLPLQLIAEVVPRYAPDRLQYDPVRHELRLLGSGVRPATAAASPRTTPRRPVNRTRRRRVVVDAGHGGPDNGMSGPIGTRWKIHEKDITLAVAKKLAAALRERGLDVVMTRTTDTLIALSDRGRIANEEHGDVFISIHVNAANLAWKRPEAARGFETYFLAEAKTEDAKRVEQMENEAVRFETAAQAAKSDPLNFIINDMAQNEHLRESSELATLIQSRLVDVEPGPSRGVKQAGFRVLVTAFMPAVLVEIGFGTNPDEARFLTNGARQKAIANAIADATVEYLEHYERRLAGGAGGSSR